MDKGERGGAPAPHGARKELNYVFHFSMFWSKALHTTTIVDAANTNVIPSFCLKLMA